MKWIFALMLLGYTPLMLANVYYDEHAKGWHWYELHPAAAPEEEQLKDPVIQMDAIKATVNKALNQAIISPTQSNVKNYLVLQNQLSNQSTLFAKVWQKVLLENPELNYSLIHPTNNTASQIDIDLKHNQEESAIKQLGTTSGLFFFYSGNCPYCKKFAPIVKSFADKYGLVVMPITTDGNVLPEFPNSKIDQGQAAKFNVTVSPSLFAVDPYTKKAYPISHGFISSEDLKKRILDIATNFQGDL